MTVAHVGEWLPEEAGGAGGSEVDTGNRLRSRRVEHEVAGLRSADQTATKSVAARVVLIAEDTRRLIGQVKDNVESAGGKQTFASRSGNIAFVVPKDLDVLS